MDLLSAFSILSGESSFKTNIVTVILMSCQYLKMWEVKDMEFRIAAFILLGEVTSELCQVTLFWLTDSW